MQDFPKEVSTKVQLLYLSPRVGIQHLERLECGQRTLQSQKDNI